jgi:hypothetical protein
MLGLRSMIAGRYKHITDSDHHFPATQNHLEPPLHTLNRINFKQMMRLNFKPNSVSLRQIIFYFSCY